MKERIVIHSDLNNFYASVEKRLNPELAASPLRFAAVRKSGAE